MLQHAFWLEPEGLPLTPVLADLHWLPIKHAIEFKILLLTFKIINNIAPCYLIELLSPYTPRKALRSS